MSKKIRRITQTALMLALLVALQALTKPLGQLVTGSFVNGILAVCALVCGFGCGLTVAVVSPLMAFALGIAPNLVTVLPIMLGNAGYVLVLYLALGKSLKPFWKPLAALCATQASSGCWTHPKNHEPAVLQYTAGSNFIVQETPQHG